MRDSTHGLVHLSSPRSASETIAKLEQVLRRKGIPIHARVDHSSDAERAGLSMNPTHLLIFGNAKTGTPLMIARPSIAIDLPLRALGWQDGDGKVWLSYNSPEYFAERHDVPGELLKNISAIKTLCEEAVSQ